MLVITDWSEKIEENFLEEPYAASPPMCTLKSGEENCLATLSFTDAYVSPQYWNERHDN